jgi:predicted nucleotide-binding protein
MRVGLLLSVLNWGTSGYSQGTAGSPSWSFQLDRRVRRLRSVKTLENLWAITAPPAVTVAPSVSTPTSDRTDTVDPKTIFLVHGHDPALHEVKGFLRDVVPGVEVHVLGEKANQGRTIIEKFEAYGGAATCAVVLLSPDDVGRARDEVDLKPRARQNVILELGYFIGRLGREHVIVVNKGGVEQPSDVVGVGYIDFLSGNWQLELMRELKAVGLDVNPSAAL